jgi:hypothetical protein
MVGDTYNLFGTRLSPMSWVRSVTHVSGLDKLWMARPKGFEPLTSAFGGQRSIQLSYGRVCRLHSRQRARRQRVAAAEPGRSFAC